MPSLFSISLVFLSLLVLVPAWVTFGRSTHSIRIPLYQLQYVQLRVGNPGKVLTLRLRWDQDQNYLYDRPESYSDTYSTSYAGSNDIFYLSDVKIRLPVTYGYEPYAAVSPFGVVLDDGRRLDTSGGVTHQGSIGLGAMSFLWRYWTGATISRHTLVLGDYDTVDVLTRDSSRVSAMDAAYTGLQVHYVPSAVASVVRGTAISSSNNNNSLTSIAVSHALTTLIGQEFTYLPIGVFRSLKRMFDQQELDQRTRQKAILLITNKNHQQQSLEDSAGSFWVGRGLNYITTAFGSSEQVMRMADAASGIVGANEVTLGRLHLLEQHVLRIDMLSRSMWLENVFDTYPRVEHGIAQQAWLSLPSLLLYAWFSLEINPMLVMWLHSGIIPNTRKLVRRLDHIVRMNWFTQLNPKPPAPSPSSSPTTTTTETIDALDIGPMDWTVLPNLLFAIQIVCVISAFVSLFGFHSVRFTERLARMAHLPSVIGAVLYYALVGFVVVVPLAVNRYFIRTYAQAGASLLAAALLATTWLNQLPETHSRFFSLSVNVLYSTFFCIRLVEWPIRVLLRGWDSHITNNIIRSGEYASDPDFLAEQPDVTQDAQRVATAIHKTVSGAAEKLNQAMNHSDTLLPVRRRPPPPPPAPPEIQHRALSWPPKANSSHVADIVILTLWVGIVIPVALAFLVCLNLLPLVEYLAPKHPWRYHLSFSYVFLLVLVWAFQRAYTAVLQALKTHTEDLSGAVSRVFDRVYKEPAIVVQ